MKQRIFSSFYIIGAISILFLSAFQLNYQLYIIDEITSKCCDNQQCDFQECSHNSRAHLKPNCPGPDYEFTCRDCMDAIGENMLCNNNHYYAYCTQDNGLKYSSYYGTEYPFAMTLTGPTYLDPYQYGAYTANVSGGITPYTYEWSIYWPCDSWVVQGGDVGEMGPPCDAWYPLGSTTNTVTRNNIRDFIIRCTVTDSHVNTNSVTQSLSVTVGSLQSVSLDREHMNLQNQVMSMNSDEFPLSTDFHLYQNYPNPFNPATNISYSLKSPGFVKLSVYDISGQLIKVLVNEQETGGYHTVSFDGSNLSSGIYIYRLETDQYASIKKMQLIK